MDEKKQRKDSLNFRDIFLRRRRSSVDELNSLENSRKNSLICSDSLKNIVSLMVGPKVGVSADPFFKKL
jgi:hypothetical protein